MQNLSNTQKFSFLIQNPKNGRELTTNVRRLLAHHFPEVKFSIRKDGGAMYSSCRISYTDGPVKKEVEKIAKLFAYDSSNCDLMTDYYEYNPADFTQTYGGFTFVFVDREASAELFSSLLEEVHRDFPTFPQQGSISREEFAEKYFNGQPTAKVGKYSKATTRAYWVSTDTLARLLFDERDYTSAQPSAPQVSTPAASLKAGGVELVEYSEKALAVFGDTRPIKDTLRELGGRFNRSLSHRGEKCAGWVFSRTKGEQLRAVLGL